METCWHCGEEIKFRYVDGQLVPIHVDGNWCQGDYDRKSNEINQNTSRDDFCRKTPCPKCGESVYFIQHNGGSFWVDALGWPWLKHPCMDSTATSWYRFLKKKEPGTKNKNEVLFSGIVVASIRYSGDEECPPQIVLAIDGGTQGRIVLSTEGTTTANYLKDKIAIVNFEKKKISLSNHEVKPIYNVGINPKILGLASNWATVSFILMKDIFSPKKCTHSHGLEFFNELQGSGMMSLGNTTLVGK